MTAATILRWVYKAAIEHEAILGLFVLAFIITMRPKLPSPFCKWEMLEWSYEWLRDGLLAFVNLRSPAHSEASERRITEPSGKVTESISVISHGQVEPAEPSKDHSL